jgi:hypothetical protein
LTLNTVRATVSFNILLTKRFKTFCAYQDLTMENTISIFGEAPVVESSSYWPRKKPLTKWQQTVQAVLREGKGRNPLLWEPVTLGEASKIASERYLLACIEEDNAKHPDARRSARLQKKATATAPPVKPSVVQRAWSEYVKGVWEELKNTDSNIRYANAMFEASSRWKKDILGFAPEPATCEDEEDDDCDSIDSPLTDEEIDAVLYDLEKHYD